MTLHLHRAPRTDLLADALGELLSSPPADPFAGELVLVPAAGVERWLSQRLSHRLGAGPHGAGGVCAGVEFRSPRSLVAALLGAEHDDPWAPDTLAWTVLAVLDECLDEPWAATLARHLGHHESGDEAGYRRSRRYAVARRVAGLLASYAGQRPDVLADWLGGDPDRPVDGAGATVPDDLSWQPPLWREVVARVSAPPPHERHAAARARLAEGPIDLPDRVSLFGHTRLSATEVDLVVGIGHHHELHLWLPHPSDTLWQRLRDLTGRVPRAVDRSHRRVGHPLAATLGRDLRELQRALPRPGGSGGLEVVDHDHEQQAIAAPETLLGWLQADLRADEPRPDGRALAPRDRSVQVHRCHGVARQVDVLREVLLDLLERADDLEPRDILVMCPDIETYAPLITARFGLGDAPAVGEVGSREERARHPGHQLRVQLADRAPSRTNPLFGIVQQLLDLAGGRATATRVLDLAQAPEVRRRFGLTDDDLETLTDWTREAGVRWGFDQRSRTPYGVDYLQNTWRFGLDRVLAGVVLSDDARAWLATTLPLDDVGSNHVELAGRFAELVDRLHVAAEALDGSRPLVEWAAALLDAVGSLTRVAADDAWQVGHLRRELDRAVLEAGELETTPLLLPDVRSLLSGRLGSRPTRANFRTGTLTVCTMVPMRSVPHRVVCMLGLDDGVFPRLGSVDGDDLLARTPLTGERDVRSEDRQLLLDALGAATETLVVTYTGLDEHTGRSRPPAVPLGELLDALDRTTETPVREQVVVDHPLQPFDPRNVARGALVPGRPFSFDPAVLEAARAASGPRPDPRGFLEAALAGPTEPDDVSLDDLVRFFRDPVKGFFTALDLALPWDADGVTDAMPVEIDQLETWGVGDRMLHDMLRLVPPEAAKQAEWRRGALPPGRLGWRKAEQVRETAESLARAALTHRRLEPRAVDVDVRLPGGRRLTGTVPSVYGDRVVSVGFSKLAGKQLIEPWLRLLALAAHDDDHAYTALAVGRAPRGTQAAQCLLATGGDGPVDQLVDLVALYDLGRRAPLPLPVRTAHAWAVAQHAGEPDPRDKAERRWRSAMYPGEDADPAHVRVWGQHAPLQRLVDPGPLGPEATLPVLLERFWLPLLAAERRL